MPELPAAALTAATRLCGFPTVELVTDRRGSAVWRANGPRGAAVIKAGTSAEGREITTREAAVMTLLRHTGVATGPGWYTAPWHAGPTTWERFAQVRDGRVLGLTDAAVGLAHAVADLHARGWVHGDLQADHAVHTPDGVRLLDLAWAWHQDFPPSPVFRGGMVHVLPPELAAETEAGAFPLRPGPAQDVYTLATVLWQAAAGAWPLDYSDAGLPADATASDYRTVIATGRLLLTAPPADRWPDLFKYLRPVLREGPENRPTAAELAAGLGAL